MADKAEKVAILPLPERRGLSREEAAGYVGISPSKFDALVADGRMPQPRVIDGRVVWDRLELDLAFSALPHRGGDAAEADRWQARL